MAMLGYEIVLTTDADEEHNALRIFVQRSDGKKEFIDLTHSAVMQLEQDLERCIDKWNRDPNQD